MTLYIPQASDCGGAVAGGAAKGGINGVRFRAGTNGLITPNVGIWCQT